MNLQIGEEGLECLVEEEHLADDRLGIHLFHLYCIKIAEVQMLLQPTLAEHFLNKFGSDDAGSGSRCEDKLREEASQMSQTDAPITRKYI